MKLTVSEIAVYPIKSLGAVTLRDSVVGRRGLEKDRRFMLVDGDGEFMTQRQKGILARVKVELTKTGIVVRYGNADELYVPLADLDDCFQESKTVRVWASRVEALIAAEPINRWFSDVLGSEVLLAYMPDGSKRLINESFNFGNEIVSFADAYPLLLANSASLAELNSRMESPLPMNRFRPNVVVESTGAFIEDNWKRVRIGGTGFRVTKPSARCVVTTIDQSSGKRHGNEPLRTLAAFRTASDVFPESYAEFGLSETDVLFGINLVPETVGGRISVGDELIVVD